MKRILSTLFFFGILYVIHNYIISFGEIWELIEFWVQKVMKLIHSMLGKL